MRVYKRVCICAYLSFKILKAIYKEFSLTDIVENIESWSKRRQESFETNDPSGVRWPGAVDTGDAATTLLAPRLSYTICGD